MSRCRLILLIVGVFTLVSPSAIAQHQWTSLGDVFWVSGADVACGINWVSQTGNRYLIASNAGDSLYSWRPVDNAWNWPQNRPGANKIISFKVIDLEHNFGNIAFCSAYNDRIYYTIDGGVDWSQVPNSQDLANKHFTSMEVPNGIENVGNIVMVACTAVENQPSTFYTADGGSNWAPIGGSSSVGMQVNDLESYPEAASRPVMAIGTPGGIYQKAELGGAWDEPWGGPVAFEGTNVPVLESVDLQGDWAQIAAVEEGLEGGCNLYFTTSSDPWSSYIPIRPGNEPFDRVVKDMAGIFWAGSGNISCYVATDDGVYKLKNPVKSGALVESEIWGPGTIVVNGDVIIPAGVTLTIEPGTTVKFVYNFDKFGSGSSSVKSEILVYGTLNANGETGNEIVFQSSRHELDPNGNDWYGIYAGVGSNITMNNCIVREADYGIFGYKVGDLTVQKCLFDHIGSTGIYLSLYQYSNPPQESLHLKVLQG